MGAPEGLPNPMPFEYGESGKDKKEKGDKKKSKTLRVPLPASEVHRDMPRSFERLLPLFEKKDSADGTNIDTDKAGLGKRDTQEPPKEEVPQAQREVGKPVPLQPEESAHIQPHPPAESTPAVTPEAGDNIPHEDLADIHDSLWSEFEAAGNHSAPHEPSHAERTEGAAVVAGEIDTPAPTQQPEVQSAPMDNPDRPMPPAAPHTEHAIDLSTPTEHVHELRAPVPPAPSPEVTLPATPSSAGLNAEVAATEPDDESVTLWEQFDNAPRAQTPGWHPESQPLNNTEQFDDILQRADMGSQFAAATSAEPAPQQSHPQPAQGAAQLRTYGSFNSLAPDAESSPPLPPTPPSEHLSATGDEGPDWHRPRRSTTGSLMRGAAVGAGLAAGAGGALAGSAAAHAAAEAGTALAGGAAAGAIAGGVAGHMAGEHAGRQQAQQEMAQTQQQTASELQQRDQRINTLTADQQAMHQRVDRLTHANQQLTNQQKAPEMPPPLPPLPQAEQAQRAQETGDVKVAHSEWVDMTVDKRTGQLAEGPGVNEFGAEFHAEQRAETIPSDPLTIALAAAKAAARTAAEVTDTYAQEHGQSIQHSYGQPLPSGQASLAQELPAGHSQQIADAEHRLPASASSSPLANALANPLLWAGVVILVLAFLAAAFI